MWFIEGTTLTFVLHHTPNVEFKVQCSELHYLHLTTSPTALHLGLCPASSTPTGTLHPTVITALPCPRCHHSTEPPLEGQGAPWPP